MLSSSRKETIQSRSQNAIFLLETWVMSKATRDRVSKHGPCVLLYVHNPDVLFISLSVLLLKYEEKVEEGGTEKKYNYTR